MIGEVRNPAGERIAYTWTAGDAARRDVIVIGHGVTSDKDRPWSRCLCTALQAVGIASVRIAFSGNGESDGRFADSNITKEVGDLAAVVDWLGEWRVGYAGHSMGGAVGVLAAARDPRIRVLVSLAAIVHTGEFVQRLFGHLEPGRDSMLDKRHCPLTAQYMDDLASIESVLPQAASIAVPWLLVHGTADEIVPVQDSRDARDAAGRRADLVALSGVDHSFTGDGMAAMTEAVVPWLDRVFDGLG